MTEALQFYDVKERFAKLLLFKEPFVAALELFPENEAWALQIALEWPLDPDVIRIKQELIDDVDLKYMPTKGAFCKQLWDKMQAERLDVDDYTKLAKLYADVRGFIDKPNVINTTNVQNNIVAENVTNIADAQKVYKEMINNT